MSARAIPPRHGADLRVDRARPGPRFGRAAPLSLPELQGDPKSHFMHGTARFPMRVSGSSSTGRQRDMGNREDEAPRAPRVIGWEQSRGIRAASPRAPGERSRTSSYRGGEGRAAWRSRTGAACRRHSPDVQGDGEAEIARVHISGAQGRHDRLADAHPPPPAQQRRRPLMTVAAEAAADDHARGEHPTDRGPWRG